MNIKREIERINDIINNHSLLRLTSENEKDKKLSEKMITSAINQKRAFQNLLTYYNK